MESPVVINLDLLKKAVVMRVRVGDRTLPQIVNSSAFWVSSYCKSHMHYTPQALIDAELLVEKEPRIGKRGKPIKSKPNYKGAAGTSRNYADVPLSVLIIQARSDPESNYNERTNSRYALAHSPFYGVSREAGRLAMKAMESRMIKGRHSSTKFLLSGWAPAVKALRPYAWRGANYPPLTFTAGLEFQDLGGFKIATDSSPNATISNRVGMEGVQGEKFNKAMNEYGLPVLVEAIRIEQTKMIARAEKMLAEANAQFNQACNP